MDRGNRKVNKPDVRTVSQSSVFCMHTRKLYLRSAVIFLIVFNGGLFQIALTRMPVLRGNELAHVRLLHSAVINGTLDIGAEPADASHYNAKYYSNKPPGFAIILMPAYHIYVWLSGVHSLECAFLFAKYSNIVFSSLSAVVVFLLLSTFRLSDKSVIFGLTAAILGTILPAYTCLATSIPLSVLLFLISMFFLRLHYLKRERALFWGISSFASVCAVTVDYSNGFLLLPAFVMLFIALRTRHIIYLLVSTFPLLLLGYYNYTAFDHPFALSYSYYQPPSYVDFEGVRQSLSLAHVPNGLYGLLLSPGRGLFLIRPVTLLGVAASLRMVKDKRRDLLTMAAAALTAIFFISTYAFWHGGHCVGYRHIIPSAIVLGIFSSFFFETSGRRARTIALALLLLSCSTGVMSFFIQRDPSLRSLTWKAEPADIHANFYTELLFPFLQEKMQHMTCRH